MIRTLIFGAIAGIVGKKLYESGKLDGIIADAKAKLEEATAQTSKAEGAPTTNRPVPPSVDAPLAVN